MATAAIGESCTAQGVVLRSGLASRARSLVARARDDAPQRHAMRSREQGATRPRPEVAVRDQSHRMAALARNFGGGAHDLCVAQVFIAARLCFVIAEIRNVLAAGDR